jgi:hypothetical protein
VNQSNETKVFKCNTLFLEIGSGVIGISDLPELFLLRDSLYTYGGIHEATEANWILAGVFFPEGLWKKV